MKFTYFNQNKSNLLTQRFVFFAGEAAPDQKVEKEKEIALNQVDSLTKELVNNGRMKKEVATDIQKQARIKEEDPRVYLRWLQEFNFAHSMINKLLKDNRISKEAAEKLKQDLSEHYTLGDNTATNLRAINKIYEMTEEMLKAKTLTPENVKELYDYLRSYPYAGSVMLRKLVRQRKSVLKKESDTQAQKDSDAADEILKTA